MVFLIPIFSWQLSELSDEDCLVAVDLVQSLIVEYLSWYL